MCYHASSSARPGMSNITDPNELAPLTELANKTVQERLRMGKMAEFATSSRWGVSAIVLELSEDLGFQTRIGFELRTPLGEPFQDVILGWGANREEAVRNTVGEWLDLALPPARAIHSDKDTQARLGETQIDNALYAWRMAAGPLRVTGPDADAVLAELAKSDLFSRLNMAGALPLQRDMPWMCVKLHMTRGAEGGGGAVTWDARINNAQWTAGSDLLRRFVLPGAKPVDLRQYLFVRRTGKRAAAASAAARPAGAAGKSGVSAPAAGATPGKKPWWKVW